MIFRKIRTSVRWLNFRLHGVSFTWSVKNNIEIGVKIYNAGKKLEIGRAFIRSNTCINTDDVGELHIGDECFFNRNCMVSCRKEIVIEDKCIFGPNVCIYDHDHMHDAAGIKPGYISEAVLIEKGCWIGAGAIILKGTKIGRGSVVAAGAIVRGEFPENSLIYSVHEIKFRPLD